MSDNRFSSRTFTNSNHLQQQNYSNANEDWDNDIDEDKSRNQTKTWSSQPFHQNFQNSSRSFQDSSRPFFNSNSSNGNSSRRRIARSYVIQQSDVPRLIGKGGGTIKQIQSDYNVHIKAVNDPQNQWADLNIYGENDQQVDDALNYITKMIGNVKEKTEVSVSTYQNNNSTHFNSTSNNTFNSRGGRGRGFASSSNNRDSNEYGSSRSKFGKSSNRRFAPGGDEDDDFNAFFGSDEETSNQDTTPLSSIFPSTSTFSNNTSDNTIKRVDWNKMRRVDTANDMTKWKEFPPVIKEFYVELPDIAQMAPEDVEALRAEKNSISVSWFDLSLKEEYEQKNNCQLTIPNPIYEFAHAFHNYPEIMKEIVKQNFLEPTPIQCQAWPIALRGLDFIGIAQTGTGKTLAFLLPALIHIDNQPPMKVSIQGPRALILSPTRELAIQIHQEVQKYSYRGIRSAVIYGGSSRKNQIFQCETGVEIIIATPGRLNDLVMSNVIDLRSVTFLVLDEADRMLDMGFEPQIVKILLDIRPDRQTIMTSATWPPDVRRIAARYMRNPVQIYVGTLDLAAVHSVHQDIEIVKEEEKFNMLLDFINRMDPEDKMIVFVDRKSSADAISSELIRKHVICQSIHGDREQSDREQALEDLKIGAVNILIATDVASRGLDIQDITIVFNYDLPKSMEDYVHRVGRTGRAGKTGYAISLVTRENWGNAGRLIKILEEAGQNVPGELREMAERFHAMQERKRELGGGRNRYGNRDNDGGGSRFFGLGSLNTQGGQHGRDRAKPPVMNSGWSFSS